jgi:hypothetical protein
MADCCCTTLSEHPEIEQKAAERLQNNERRYANTDITMQNIEADLFHGYSVDVCVSVFLPVIPGLTRNPAVFSGFPLSRE